MSCERGFDFLIGDWTVAHRKLRERLAGCDIWDEFLGTSTVRPLLGGNGNCDDNLLHEPRGTYAALTFRRYVRETDYWLIWWVDARTMRLEPPVSGRFAGGVGRFLGDDEHAGRPVRVRFVWSDLTVHGARWEQAFSIDDGVNWEVNWVMQFRRAPIA